MKKSLTAFLASLIITLPFVASADDFTHWLTVGSRGPEVLQLQTILQAGGYLSVGPTGYFGSMTRLAVLAYQKANGLEQVGSVGPKTRALLNAYLAGFKKSLPPIPPVPTNASTPASQNTPATSSSANASTSAPAPAPVPTSSPNDPPHVTLVSPASVIPRTSTQTSFSVTTDKPAYCKYGTQPGMTLSSMTSFTYSGGTTHTSELTNLSVDALYVYYVRCTDMNDRQSQEMTVSFSVTGK